MKNGSSLRNCEKKLPTFPTQPKMNNLFWPDEKAVNNILLPTLFNVVKNIEQVVEPKLACNQV